MPSSQAAEQPGGRQERNWLTQLNGKFTVLTPDYCFSMEGQITTCLCHLQLLRLVLAHCWKFSLNSRDVSFFLRAPPGTWQLVGAQAESLWKWPWRSCQHRKAHSSCADLKNSCQMGRMGAKSFWVQLGEEAEAGYAFLARWGGHHHRLFAMWLQSLLGDRLASKRWPMVGQRKNSATLAQSQNWVDNGIDIKASPPRSFLHVQLSEEVW